MSSLVETLVQVLYRKLRIPLLYTCKGTVVSEENGTYTVDSWWGRVHGVKIAMPFPEFSVTFAPGAGVYLLWPREQADELELGSEGLPVIIGYYSGAVSKITVGESSLPAARKTDDIEVSLVGPAGATKINELATWLLATGAFVATGSIPALTTMSELTLPGSITGGSGKVEVG